MNQLAIAGAHLLPKCQTGPYVVRSRCTPRCSPLCGQHKDQFGIKSADELLQSPIDLRFGEKCLSETGLKFYYL